MKLMIVLLLVGCNLLFLSCRSDDKCKSDDDLEAKLKTAIRKAEPDSKDSTIDIAKLADFEWDELLVVGPYAIMDSLSRDGIKSDCLEQTHMETRDNACVLAFLKNKKLVRYIDYPRWPGDFAPTRAPLGYKLIPRQKSVFYVKSTNQKTQDGELFLQMEEVVEDSFQPTL